MNKHSKNFYVDIFAFVLFLFLASTGLVMHYTLPPGSHSVNVWGLGRHDWGSIHFWIAVALVASIALHIILHWSWVTRMVKGTKSPASHKRRVWIGIAAFLVLVAVSVAPFFGKRMLTAGGGTLQDEHESPATIHDGQQPVDGIRGSTTVAELSMLTGVSEQQILNALLLPADTPSDSRLRHLGDAHGFDMETVRNTVARLQQELSN